MKYILLLTIIAVISVISLVVIISLTKFNKYKEKINISNKIIDENLESKLNSIKSIDKEIKKVIDDKDYLKDYIQIENSSINNIEMDIKLNEAEIFINKLLIDNSKLNKSTKIKKILVELRMIDEKIVSAKTIYNKNAYLNNYLLKAFPNNIIAKIFNYKIINYYNNKTDEDDSF